MTTPGLSGALAALERGDLAAAHAGLVTAVGESPDDPELRLAAAACAQQLGLTHESVMRLLQAAALAPDSAEPYRALGEIFRLAGDADRAELYFQNAALLAVDNLEPLLALLDLYQDEMLPYSAKATARAVLAIDPGLADVARLLAQLEHDFPDRAVTLYIPCYNAAAYLPESLPAALGQSYPITELLLIDDGSTDDSVAVAAAYPVRIITVGENRGLAHARNVALGCAGGEYLASLDSDVVAHPHWLERLMVRFEAERLAQEAGEPVTAPLAGMMGRLTERHDVGLANQWRSLHCAQHHGEEPLWDAPECYGCNGVWRREVLLGVGGFDERFRTNGEDSMASATVRSRGFRLAYEPAARCEHLRRDDLTSILNTVWRYHVPYYEHLHGIFDTGAIEDVLKKAGENLRRHQDNLNLENDRRAYQLAYVTFLGLPWRVLSDMRLLAARCPEAVRPAVLETHAVFYLAMFALLADQDARDDLLRMVWEDTAPVRPDDEAAAAACSWDNVLAVIRASRTDGAPSPLHQFTRRDPETVNGQLRLLSAVWTKQEPLYWSIVRASALALRDERADADRPTTGPRVAVVNPPWVDGDRIGVRAGSRWPFTQDARGQRVPAYLPFPFFLATAAAMCRRDGYPTLMIDAIAEGLRADEFVGRLRGWAPDIVVMETATASHAIDLDWALRFKEQLGPDARVVLCGPHATALAAETMAEAPHIDAILLGEYEPVLSDLLARLRDDLPLDDIQGIYWRDETGAVTAQPERRKLPPMAGFPWPERVTLPMYNYFDSFANAMPWPNVQMHASRGCPYQCIFCVWPQVVYAGQNYRTRDNADIVAEMSWLVDRYGFRAVYFDDDTFNIKNDRIIDLCDRIAAADLGVPICAMGRADTSSREAFEAMKRAGVVGLKFGVETGDEAMMERIHKGLDLQRVRESVAWCKELGIGTHLTFSFGGPGETHETAARTIALALELDPDTVQFSLMTPFPGTTMFHDAIERGTLLTTDWSQFDGARYTVVRGEYLTREELEQTLRDAHRQWLLHVTERGVRRQLQRLGGPAERAGAEQLAALPDDGAEALQLQSCLTRRRDLDLVLDEALAKLAPGGLLTVFWEGAGDQASPTELRIDAWAAEQRVPIVHKCGGFGGEVAAVLRKPLPTVGQAAADRRAMLVEV